MFPFSHILSLAAAVAFVVFTAASLPARADEMVQNLGPVGPHEPILTAVGSKRVIAFYQPDSGKCAVHLVLWNPADGKAGSTVGYEATLNPRQMAHIDIPESQSFVLQCDGNAERLAIVDPSIVDPSKCVKFVAAAAPN